MRATEECHLVPRHHLEEEEAFEPRHRCRVGLKDPIPPAVSSPVARLPQLVAGVAEVSCPHPQSGDDFEEAAFAHPEVEMVVGHQIKAEAVYFPAREGVFSPPGAGSAAGFQLGGVTWVGPVLETVLDEPKVKIHHFDGQHALLQLPALGDPRSIR